jgi:toxin ParE1/3/4
MPYLVRLLPRAEHDLEAIYGFIGASSSEMAHRWFTKMVDAIETLAELPERCPRIPEDPTLRHLLYGKRPHIYRIIFSVDATRRRVDIVHVRHGAQDTFEG